MYISMDKDFKNFTIEKGEVILNSRNNVVNLQTKAKSYIRYAFPAEYGEKYTFKFFARKINGMPKARLFVSSPELILDEVVITSTDFKKYELSVTVPYTYAGDRNVKIDLGTCDGTSSSFVKMYNPVLSVEDTPNGVMQIVSSGVISGTCYKNGTWSNKSADCYGVKKVSFFTETHKVTGDTTNGIYPAVKVELNQPFPDGETPDITFSSSSRDLCQKIYMPYIHYIENVGDNRNLVIVFLDPDAKTAVYDKYINVSFNFMVFKR